MNEHSYKIEALILGRRNQGEGDRILTALSQKRGKIFLLAKGVRKLSSHRGGKMELFNLIRAQVFSGKTWDILGEVSLIKSYPRLKKKLKRTRAAYEVCEIASKFLPEKEANETVFLLVKESLERLDYPGSVNIDHLLFSFKVKLLKITGFWHDDRSLSPLELDRYIEEITQSKIKSQKIDL